MAKRIVRREWTVQDEKELKKHSKNKTPVKAISKELKRTPGAIRQKARNLGISVGHRRQTSKRPKRVR
jgi:ribosomal protein L13E